VIIENLPKHKVAIFSEINSEIQEQNSYSFWIHQEVLNYLKNSLRLKPKDNLIIFDSFNYINYCRYILAELNGFNYNPKNKHQNFIEVKVKKVQNIKLSNLIINLYIVPPKNRYFNDLLANVVQLPIDTIYFFPSEYMISNISELEKKVDKIKDIVFWNTIYVSKYYSVNVKILSNFKEFVEHLKFYNWVIVFHPYTNLTISDFFRLNEINSIFNDTLKKMELKNKIQQEKFRIAIIVGCEGGFSEKEINIFKDNKAFILRFDLIENIVKTEIAANVGVSQFLSIFNYLLNT
jgi:RsmE family RNA methyltransferase